MRNDLVSRTQRGERLQASLTVAHKLRPLLDADVTAYFDGVEKGLTDKIIDAKTDDERRDAAFEVRAWRRFRSDITSKVAGEARIETKLRDMITNG